MRTETMLEVIHLLYKGKRMLVVDNVERHLDEDYDVVGRDGMLDCEVGFCNCLTYESIAG